VVEEGPTHQAGLQGSGDTARIDRVEVPLGGDVIVAIDDQSVTGMDHPIVCLVEELGPVRRSG
jgi:hypothetical protein